MVVGVEPAGHCGGPFGVERAQSQRVLIGERVLADHLDHLELQRAVACDQPSKAHQPTRRPGFIRTVLAIIASAPREHEIDLRADAAVAEQRVDRTVARVVLLAVVTILAITALLGLAACGDERQ